MISKPLKPGDIVISNLTFPLFSPDNSLGVMYRGDVMMFIEETPKEAWSTDGGTKRRVMQKYCNFLHKDSKVSILLDVVIEFFSLMEQD